MSEIDHELCRYLLRDEAVRAAEDAAAVPAIQHRDLPEVVALLWASVGDLIGRVVRLEGEMDAGQDEEAAPAEGMRKEHGESVRVVEETKRGRLPDMVARLTAERDAAIRERRAAQEEVEDWSRRCGRILDERDAAIRERDEARAECERLRACADPFGEELAVIAAWERCAITADWPADEPETAVRCAASMEREILRLRARVAELEAAPPPRGWLTAEERDLIAGLTDDDVFTEEGQNIAKALLARETPPKVKVPPGITIALPHEREQQWIAAIRAAGGEVEG